MTREKITILLQQLTGHSFFEIVLRGDSAIKSALSILSKGAIVLIPDEGGWLSYKKIPQELGLNIMEVKCDNSKINLDDLNRKLSSQKISALLYQNPGGYFAEQPMEEIYKICRKKNCLVIVDVSGAIGTKLCNGKYADIFICSFGEWKLVEAKTGGFISAKDEKTFQKIKFLEKLEDKEKLKIISEKINDLDGRIKFLQEKRNKIIKDLQERDILHKRDTGFVVVVKFTTAEEKEKIINYCQKSHLEWTECPRYIRVNQPAISIEVKRLEQ